MWQVQAEVFLYEVKLVSYHVIILGPTNLDFIRFILKDDTLLTQVRGFFSDTSRLTAEVGPFLAV